MGLTIHYELKAKGSATQARKLVESLHQKAHDLPYKEVGEIVDLSGSDCDFDKRPNDDPLRWLLKDVLGGGVEMPIAEYPDFEQLELAGQSQLPPEIEQLAQLIKQVSLKR